MNLAIDDYVWAIIDARARLGGLSLDEFVVGILRRELGFNLIERTSQPNDLPETEAMELAIEAQPAVRQDSVATLGEEYEAAWRETETDV